MATDTSANVMNFERLDVNNYATWRERMESYLIVRDLWDAVTADRPGPAADRKALALIKLCVKDHHLPILATCETAKEAWHTLEEIYQAKSNARTRELRKELTKLKMGHNEPLTKYVARAKDIQTQLLAAGHEVSDQEVTWHLLDGLTEKFETIVTVLETTATTDMSLDDILPKLLQVEQRNPHLEPTSMEKALAAKRHNAPTPPTYRETRTCYYCGETGHIARNCPKKKHTNWRNQASIAL